MSADRDRGIRRQKQKRAKTLKKQSREQRQVAAAQPASGNKPAARKTA